MRYLMNQSGTLFKHYGSCRRTLRFFADAHSVPVIVYGGKMQCFEFRPNIRVNVIPPGTLPECVQCLTKVCSELKKIPRAVRK